MIETKKVIYLDQAATSWPKPPGMAQCINEFFETGCANPGRSGHRMSVETARSIFLTREAVAKLLGAKDPLQIVFTNNGTMAINYAIHGLLKPGDHVITSSMEHNSVMRPLRNLEKTGLQVTILPCSLDGSLDPLQVQKALRPTTKMVILTHASNVTGTIMPLSATSRICQEAEVIFMVDGAQTAGLLPVDVEKSGIDIFAFTGHKALLGPGGTGGLYIRKGLEHQITPLIQGGTGSLSELEEQPDFLPDKFEAGTPNSIGIVALGFAINYIEQVDIRTILIKEMALTGLFLDQIRTIKGVSIHGKGDTKGRIGTISLNIDGYDASEVAQQLDEEFAIMTRPGLHCAPSAHRTLRTFPKGTVRFSFGYFNSDEEIRAAVRAIDKIAHRGNRVF